MALNAVPKQKKTFSWHSLLLQANYIILYYWTLLSIMREPEFHSDFWQKKYFYFSRLISQELIIASLIIIKAILNPFSATFHV